MPGTMGQNSSLHHEELAIERLPTLFVSHGAPTFAMEPGMAGPKLAALGEGSPGRVRS